MNRVAANRDLPAFVPDQAALYLKPLKGLNTVELIVRQGSLIQRVVSSPGALDHWASRQPEAIAARVASLCGDLNRSATLDWAKGRKAPLIMGVVNVTSDSFSDGGDHADPEAAIAHGRRLIDEGADILDIGGESTRPGALPPPLEVERARVIPVIEALAPFAPMLSIDTRRAAIMAAALDAGATMLNDVSALTHDPASLGLVEARDVPVVLMHMQGTPEAMQRAPRYDDAPLDIFDFLEARIAVCEAAGIPRRRLIVDPGIGFGKTLTHNLDILHDLAVFRGLGCPIMVGVSRKGFIGRLTGAEVPRDRLAGSLATALHAVDEGATILRVHDVSATRQALAMWAALHDDAIGRIQ
ncbi:MAG: dihydropteroate synthase [Alphaproteobacteria bacterium]|nr:dihydropteroate synthase [Alphaproteobacteria bacterium]